MKPVAIAIVLGFVLYPIAYNIPITGDAANVGRLFGGGVAMSVAIYIVLRIALLIWRKIAGVKQPTH